MAINEIATGRDRERLFFLLVAICFPLIVLAGFARTYYLKGFFGTPPVASMLVHLHGAVMTTLVALFVTQILLIRTKNVKTHQKLGIAGAALSVVVIVVGISTAIAAAKNGSASAPPNIPPLVFLVVPLGDILLFTLLFGAAVYYRRRPENHKRLILLTVMNFMPPAIARLPITAIAAAGPLAFFGIPDLLALLFVAFDAWKNRELNKVFALGALLLIASHPLRLMLGGTDAWLRFATWLTT